MTVTLVYGDATDGYLHSGDASYTNARNGPADGVNGGASGNYGQNNNFGIFTQFQTFLKFTALTPTAEEVVTTATIRTYSVAQVGTGVVRDMELRGTADWTVGGLTTSDWLNPGAMSTTGLFARVVGVQASNGKTTWAGSEDLRLTVASGSPAIFVVVSSRQRAGTVPTSDEGSALATSEASGTPQDPCLVYGTAPRSTLFQVLGAAAQLSDGTTVGLVTDANVAAPTIQLRHWDATGASLVIQTLPIGTGATQFANVPGGQGYTLAVDSSDNIYVLGRAGDSDNSLKVRAYRKGTGYVWTSTTVRTAALPAHDAPINNVAAAWHSTAGGTLMCLAAHQASQGESGGTATDVVYALLATAVLLADGGGAFVRASGSALGTMLPAGLSSGDFNGYANETGTGLDVAADWGQPDWGYVTSFKRSQVMGDNLATVVGRYILNATADGFTHTSNWTSSGWSRKDPGTRLRLLAVGSGQVALLSADEDTGFGLILGVLQASGSTSGFVELGSVSLAGESIPTMPDGPAVASSSAWDAVYSTSENLIWVYYVDTTNANRVKRTSVSMSSYNATRAEVTVYTAPGPVRSIRAARNARVTGRGSVVVAYSSAGVHSWTHVADQFNLAPTAPTLTQRVPFDATAAATLAWIFNDPNLGDSQTYRQVQVQRVSDGVTVIDTAGASTATTYVVAGGTLANGVNYRWRVLTRDLLGLDSPWSDWGTFNTSAGGSVTITDPATDNAPGFFTDDTLITWTATGTVPAKTRVTLTRNDTGALIGDTGWVNYSGISQNYISGMVSDVEHAITVQVENAVGVRSGIGTRLMTPSYGVPEVPLVTLLPVPEEGYVLVDVENPIPLGDRPDVVRNLVLRRRAGTQDPWETLGTCEPDGGFRDYTAPSRTPVEYMVRGESS